MAKSKHVDAGLVAWVPPSEDKAGRYIVGGGVEDDGSTPTDVVLVQLVQDEPDNVENGEGHYEIFDGDEADYRPAV